MKRIQYLLFVLLIGLTACNDKDSIWNVVGDMDERLTTLEVLCEQMNTNIEALEALVEAQGNGDYITSVTEIRSGSTVVGYTITFKSHEPITIYNGTNGKDGTDGVNGYTPTIGAKQDTDGVYYWTVDGAWLTDADSNKIRVTGEKGDKGDKGDTGEKGDDGQDGADGTDGTNGVNGNTPQLKIEDGYWYLSYDGTNWTKLGKATGENGTNGADGEKGDRGDKGDKGEAGDNIFSSVTQDDNYVYFTLADGTLIKIAKGSGSSDSTHADSDIIEFKDLNVKSALLLHTPVIDTNGDGEISYGEARAAQRISIIKNTSIVSFKELQYFTGLTSVCFNGCTNLFELVLPNGLDSLSESAFAGNTKLKSIIIPTPCKYISKSAFAECTSLNNITLPNSVTYIGESAFYGCTSLNNITLPNSVTYIGESAFYGCTSITSFAFPENYSDTLFIFGTRYYSTSEPSFHIPDTIVWNTKSFPTVYYSSDRYWGYYGLIGKREGGYSSEYVYFSQYPKVVHFGDHVKTIPAYLCYHMAGLTEIEIPEGVTTIGTSAFYGCKNVKTIVLPSTLESIGGGAFCYSYNSTSWKVDKVYCKALTPPVLLSSGNPFSSVGLIYVPRSSVNDYKTAWSAYAGNIVGYDFE